MPQARKYFVSRKPYLITTRINSGLPLVCTEYMKTILWSILARAQRLHPVKLCHFLYMGNHPHFLPVAEDAETVVQFIRYVKKETTEAIKRLTRNSKLSLWEEGYDSPQLLTPTTVIKYIRYRYIQILLTLTW